MSAFRQNDRQTTPPRTNARPRRTLLGRFKRAWYHEQQLFRTRPVITVGFTLLTLASGIWLRHTYPRGFMIGLGVYWVLVLIQHFWSNRGAE